jgi:hypothetical protein
MNPQIEKYINEYIDKGWSISPVYHIETIIVKDKDGHDIIKKKPWMANWKPFQTKPLTKEEAIKAGGSYLRFGWRIVDSEEDDATLKRRQQFRRLFDPNFKDLPEAEIQSTGYVLHSLEAAIWCLLQSSNYKEAPAKHYGAWRHH